MRKVYVYTINQNIYLRKYVFTTHYVRTGYHVLEANITV